MGLQMQIISILRFSWSILVKALCSSANELQQNSNASREDYIPQILAVFFRDSSRLHLTFAAFCLLSVIRKQKLKQWNYSVHHLALLTGFRTDFTSSLLPFAGEDIIPQHIALEYDWPLLSKLCRSALFCRFPALKAFVRFNDSCVIIVAVLKEVFFCCHLLWMFC